MSSLNQRPARSLIEIVGPSLLSEICYYITDMRDLTLKVLGRVKAGRPGAVFTTKAFGDLGKRASVDQALSRLARAGKIRRLSRGVYDFPKTHPALGSLSPDPDAVAKAIADQAGYRLQPTPARAANALGLSSQVPAQIVYLTDGSSRKIATRRKNRSEETRALRAPLGSFSNRRSDGRVLRWISSPTCRPRSAPSSFAKPRPTWGWVRPVSLRRISVCEMEDRINH